MLLRSFIYIFLALFSLSTISASAQQTTVTTVERKVIVTPVPEPKEVITTPTGYANCFTVQGGWHQDRWVPEHKVCQYENVTEGVAWVEGYWACNQFTAEGSCTGWEWRPAHWVKSLDVY